MKDGGKSTASANLDGHAFCLRARPEELLDRLGDRPTLAVSNLPTVNLSHRRQLSHCSRGEHLVRRVELKERDAPLLYSDAGRPRNLHDGGAGDARQTELGQRRHQHAAAHAEEVGRVGLGDKALGVEHDGVRCISHVGLDLRQNVVDEVAVVDLRVDALRRVAAVGSSDKADAFAVVVGGSAFHGLPLRKDDQAAAVDVELWVHGAGGLLAAAQREPHVRTVGHAVGLESGPNGIRDELGRGHVLKGHGFGRGKETAQVLVQMEDASAVHAHAFPYCVAALNRRVKDGHGCILARAEAVADPDEDVAVALVWQARQLQAVVLNGVAAGDDLAGDGVCLQQHVKGIGCGDERHEIGRHLRLAALTCIESG
eukprot:m.102286 g.102286  ORF g.102286 m.102286 type:complete len:370 (-) comp15684_c0_seq1:872-1981(-)